MRSGLTERDTGISDKWIKASIIGTIWAAAEIVLGSFLHNLRVPFSGNVLTAIALVILISLSHKWREKGLYWRAGIICALMKTMSPSAIIFGPMIAIIAESFLLEASVRLFGRTYAGFIIGSMLAMSWNLFQKILNLIIFYGGNLVDLYSNLTRYAARELNLKFDTFWAPLLLLLALYAVFGAASAVIGIRTGRRIVSHPAETEPTDRQVTKPVEPRSGKLFKYSLAWLVTDILLVAGSLLVVGLANWIYWVLIVIPVVAVLAIRYKRAMRQLARPGFWITFVIITMLSALAFTAFRPGSYNITEGILIGIQMNFRALIIIIGFSSLGTELYNPKIRQLFSRTHFRQLPLALELSAESLPSMIAAMPDLKTAIKDPALILSSMISRVERRLSESRAELQQKKKVYIITGETGEGKTSLLQKLTEILKDKGIREGGILAPRIMEGATTTGYDILDIRSGDRSPFLRVTNPEISGIDKFTRFDEGYEVGIRALDPANNTENEVMVIDEAGPLELRGEGWAGRISELLSQNKWQIILVVRKSLINEVVRKFGIKDFMIIEAGNRDEGKIVNEILNAAENG
ncbi:MAG: nucleoside-triphosphatase [Bacteroidales bacterium]